MVTKFHVSILIEVPDHVHHVIFNKLSVPIFFEVFANRAACKDSRTCSVNSFKCCIWLKVNNRGKHLPQFLNANFFLRITDEEVL